MNLKRISASCFCLLLAGQMTLSAQNVSFSSNKVTLKSAFEKIENGKNLTLNTISRVLHAMGLQAHLNIPTVGQYAI